jgi:hypothetical protein
MSAPVRLSGAALAAFSTRLAAASALHADLLADSPLEARTLETPTSLGDVTLYDVAIHARQRPIEMLVADVGDELIVLGDQTRVDHLARRVGLHLDTREEVVDYLRFWCRAARRHTETLVESAADFQWIPGVTTDPDLRAHADRAARLARHIAVGHPAAGAFPAEVTMLDQRTLHLRHLRVGFDGHVDEISRQMLTDEVPVPYVIP